MHIARIVNQQDLVACAMDGDLSHPCPSLPEQAWSLWLRATAGNLRVDCLAQRVCGAPDEYAMLAAVNSACAPTGDNATLSHLFSIYIHPSPLHKGYPKGSIFRGREINPRVKVEWGSWAIMEVRFGSTRHPCHLCMLHPLACSTHLLPSVACCTGKPTSAAPQQASCAHLTNVHGVDGLLGAQLAAAE